MLVCAQVPGPIGEVKIREAGRLELHKPVERDVGPGEADIFTLEVHAGDFIHLVAEQEGVDVVLEILDAKGREVVSIDSPNREFGPEPAAAIANQTGAYRIKVATKPERLIAGKYRLEVLDLHSPTDKDRLLMQVQEVFLRAVADERAGSKESRTRAIEEYTAANEIWRKLPIILSVV